MNTPPDRLGAAFATAKREGRVAFIPFATAGYPSAAGTVDLLLALADAGADIIELGVPFSDPIADGATIQRTSQHALAGGMTVSGVVDVVVAFRRRSSVPLVLMTYVNPIRTLGEDGPRVLARAGVDGVLVTDLPPDVRPEWWAAFREARLATIQLVAPTTRAERVPAIAAAASGFVYAVSRAGVTGRGGAFSVALPDQVARIRAASPLPVAVGFGVREAADVTRVARFADGVVVGAALLERILTAAAPAAGIHAAAAFAADLRAATKPVP